MKRFCLALDLVDDPALIKEYEYWHQPENNWEGIKESITDSGIIDMQLFRTGNRLFMIMDTEDDFSFEKKSLMDASNPKVQEWEQFVWKFQQALPWAKPGEKWVLMDRIFKL